MSSKINWRKVRASAQRKRDWVHYVPPKPRRRKAWDWHPTRPGVSPISSRQAGSARSKRARAVKITLAHVSILDNKAAGV